MEHLAELRDRVLTLPSLENLRATQNSEIVKAEQEVANLLRQYEQERRDVELIQKESFSSFVLKVIGKYEDKLKKERGEEIAAKLAYDRAVVRLDSLRLDKDELSRRITILRGEERTYREELENRRQQLLSGFNEPQGLRYSEIENERKAILSQITEIKEAIRAAAAAKATAQSAFKNLDDAKDWATFDVFTSGGIVSYMAKYSHVDDAEKAFSKLSAQLKSLKSEIGDVEGLKVSGLNEISSSQRTIDFWFDNIFTDISVREQIIDNIETVRRLIRDISSVESALETRMREQELKLSDNNRRTEELLINGGNK